MAARADEWQKEFSAKPVILVTADDGSIRVTASREPQVHAMVNTGGWHISAKEVRVDWSEEENRVVIKVHVPSGTHVAAAYKVKIELRVPPETDLDLHSRSGKVEIIGVKGAHVMESGRGTIEAREVEGTLKADTGYGDVRAEGRFDVLNAHTGNGNIVAAAHQGSRMKAEWSLRTGDGNVSLRLPADFAADLRADTGEDGSITSDFAVASSDAERSPQALHGKMNGGGPTLELRSENGAIKITRF
ncbi:MAG: DUF4097 family beta strand repeat-containing protein [Terriglobales bacterium]